LFNGTAGLVKGFCDVAGGKLFSVQRDWLMGFVTLNGITGETTPENDKIYKLHQSLHYTKRHNSI
jgi:hypothetical protein